MGWWKIDPETGEPAKDKPSKLSKPPDFVLLNAVPGTDDKAEAHFLGDGPWDMSYSAAQELMEQFPDVVRLSLNALSALLMEGVVPAELASAGQHVVSKVLQLIKEFWADIDWCYKEDWERPARPAERRWVCDYFLEKIDRFKGQ
jgi:hypothetical protein